MSGSILLRNSRAVGTSDNVCERSFTKKMAKFFWATLLMILLIPGCSESSNENTHSLGNPKITLSDVEPYKGMCAGWQKSLAKGHRADDIEYCLREKALSDRLSAVEEANKMMSWQIKESHGSQLKPLITTLSRFPEAGSLKQYLSTNTLLPNKPDMYNRLDKALTASDYLRDLGNVYWFDAETGMFPNRHDILLRKVAALSTLKEAEFSEEAPVYDRDDKKPYKLHAAIKGQSYRQEAANYGDWYDIAAVVNLLNKIALDQSSESRIVTLPTNDQTAIIWVVESKRLNLLLDAGLLSFSPEEASMLRGKAFEAAARKEIETN